MPRRPIPPELRKLPVSVTLSDRLRALVDQAFPGKNTAKRLRSAIIAGLKAQGVEVPWGMA